MGNENKSGGIKNILPPLVKQINIENFKFENNQYYFIEAAFNKFNPIHKYLFHSGFVDDKNIPCGYNSIIHAGAVVGTYNELHYLKVIKKVE